MMIKREWQVFERFEGHPPEEFGHTWLTKVPKVGDVIWLHWLNGELAYQLRIEVVEDNHNRLHGRAVKGSEAGKMKIVIIPTPESRVLLVSTDGRRRYFETASDAALFMLGKNMPDWQMYNRNLKAESNPDMNKIQQALQEKME